MNPLYKQNKQQAPNVTRLKEVLQNKNDDFFKQMIQLARQRGISENDIQAGMRFIDTLRH